MSDVKVEKQGQKGKKVGADGLNKKERRAQKVLASGNKETKPEMKEIIVDEKPKGAEKCSKKPEVVANGNNSEQKEQVNNEGKTKAELKALRKAEFEKQRALQEMEKKPADNSASKAQLRAERRALQEKQRQTKAAGKTEQSNNKPEENKMQQDENKAPKQNIPAPTIRKKAPVKKDVKKKHPHLEMVGHMYYHSPINDVMSLRPEIHPAFIELGTRSSFKTIAGANSRCLALLAAIKDMLTEFESPPNQEFCRSLEAYLQGCVEFLGGCRPLSAGMLNILRCFKLKSTKIDSNKSDKEKKLELTEYIDTYITNEIEKAGESISLQVFNKISNGDVILTYGCSSIVEKILVDAHKKGKQFSVVIVDSRPFSEGKMLLARLLKAGINCEFVLVNSINAIMTEVTTILLGAQSLLSNGYVMSRIGSGQIAMIGKDFGKTVLICCETYKFCDRVQTDSYVFNEIGNCQQMASELIGYESLTLTNWKESDNVVPLNLFYDVALPDFVSAVVTELGILPCTSVPGVLRYKLF